MQTLLKLPLYQQLIEIKLSKSKDLLFIYFSINMDYSCL